MQEIESAAAAAGLAHHQLVPGRQGVNPSPTSNGGGNAGNTLTSAAPRGSRGSSRGSSGEESSEVSSELLKGDDTPHHSGGSSGGDLDTDRSSPMDLSGAATMTVMARMEGSSTSGHPLLNAKRLAELVRAQQQQSGLISRQRELNEKTPPNPTVSGESISRHPKKRPYLEEMHLESPTSETVAPLLMGPSALPKQLVRAFTPNNNQTKDDKKTHEDSSEEEEEINPAEKMGTKPLIPLELIRSRWEGETAAQKSVAEAATEKERSSPESNSSGSNNSSGHENVEVKKRRLDALLSKKFSSSNSMSPPTSISHRRDSAERSNNHRRKQSHPTTSPSPPSNTSSPQTAMLALRSPAELLLSSSPLLKENREREEVQDRDAEKQEALKGQILQLQLAQAALLSGAASAAASVTPSTSATSSPSNPLLYYGYYAQMLQNLQAQQHKLVEELLGGGGKKLQSPVATPSPPPPASNKSAEDIIRNLFGGRNVSGSTNGFKLPSPNATTPVKIEARHTETPSYDHFSPRPSPRTTPLQTPPPPPPSLPLPPPPMSSLVGSLSPLPLSGLPSTSSPSVTSPPPTIFSSLAAAAAAYAGHHNKSGLSAGHDSEPRRRAPRALTGRHVRSGTGASPRVLEILKKKLLERMRLKELLGENSHLYFGALNKQKKGALKLQSRR